MTPVATALRPQETQFDDPNYRVAIATPSCCGSSCCCCCCIATLGGRFALIEVGHAAHSLALRLTKEKLAGFELGGLLDREILRLLRLQDRPARVALGYACGLP